MTEPNELADHRDAGPILLVTGMSGAGKSSVLKALEDLNYEAVDNLPLSLLRRLLAVPGRSDTDKRPLAFGMDTRTRAFDAEQIVQVIKQLRDKQQMDVRVLFLDASGDVLSRRFSETRRRHPLALDRSTSDGISRERELLAPLRRWADIVIDTSDFSINDLRRVVRERFARRDRDHLTITISSFGYARGVPRDADLVFDMRFLTNPHWHATLRPFTGLDPAVQKYISADPTFEIAFEKIADLLLMLLPRYRHEGKSYLTVAFGCTGGKHRSVFVAQKMAAFLSSEGYSPTVTHRDLKGQGVDAEEFEQSVDRDEQDFMEPA